MFGHAICSSDGAIRFSQDRYIDTGFNIYKRFLTGYILLF